MSYTLNKTGAQIDAILNRATAGGQLDLDIAAEAAARAAADALKAPLASPALTGTPTAPTAAPGTDTTQLATTAFANAAAAAAAASAASGKADKVAGATAGNLAGLDASGNLTDAGIAAADVATKADVQNITPKRTASNDPSTSSFSVLCDTALNGEAKPKLYGKSVVINQQLEHGNFDYATGWTASRGTIGDPVQGVLPYQITTVGASANDNRIVHEVSVVNGHNYLLTYDILSPVSASPLARLAYSSADITPVSVSANTWAKVSGIVTATVTRSDEYIWLSFAQQTATVGATVQVKNAMCIDLTACGFTSSETASVSALKTAWLKKFGYPMPQYIPYNAGSIVSNNATYLMHGRNLWDEEWEVGGYNTATGAAETDTRIRSKNPIAVEPNTTYYSMNTAWVLEYDAYGNYLGIYNNGAGQTFTTSASTKYLKFKSAANITTYAGNICINLSDASFNGSYEAWYDGGSVTADSLNGIGTAVDSQDAEGAITRRIGSVDLGTLTFERIDAGTGFFVFAATVTGKANGKYNLLSALFINEDNGGGYSSLPNKGIVGRADSAVVYIRDDSYSTAAAFKTAMNGVMLAYELATPTTSTTSAANIQTQAGYNSLDPVAGDVQSGDAECEYPVDVIAYIDKKLAEL